MSHPLRVDCFCEDMAHEQFITAIIQRAAEELNVVVQIKKLSATLGSRVWHEFRQYLRELTREHRPLPDVIVVVIDGNCKRASRVRGNIEQEVQNLGLSGFRLVCAVPDPHIERWYLEDQQAVNTVLPGARPQKLRYKCERGRYKQALRQAIRAASVEPLFGGAEYGSDIARKLEPSRLDRSFRKFWKDLCAALKSMARLKSDEDG